MGPWRGVESRLLTLEMPVRRKPSAVSREKTAIGWIFEEQLLGCSNLGAYQEKCEFIGDGKIHIFLSI